MRARPAVEGSIRRGVGRHLETPVPLYLQIEFESRLTDSECNERIVSPFRELLSRENLGTVIGAECLDPGTPPGSLRPWEIAIRTGEPERARDLVLPLLKSRGAD